MRHPQSGWGWETRENCISYLQPVLTAAAMAICYDRPWPSHIPCPCCRERRCCASLLLVIGPTQLISDSSPTPHSQPLFIVHSLNPYKGYFPSSLFYSLFPMTVWLSSSDLGNEISRMESRIYRGPSMSVVEDGFVVLYCMIKNWLQFG